MCQSLIEKQCDSNNKEEGIKADSAYLTCKENTKGKNRFKVRARVVRVREIPHGKEVFFSPLRNVNKDIFN